MILKSTKVFSRNWKAIHELNEDGSRKYRYIVNRGSSRSSKTISLIDLYDLYARQNDNKRMTVWRDTKTDCKKTVLSDTLKHHKKTNRYEVGYTFNKTESIFTYDNGSTVEIHGTDDSETVHGLTQDAAWFNEPYKISRETFDQIDQRTSDFVLIDYNPKKGHWVEDLMKDPRTIVIHSTFRDNAFCPPEQKAKILSYQPIKKCELVLSKLLTEREANEYDLVKNPLKFTDKQIRELSRCRENEFKNSASEYNWDVYGLGVKAERPNRIFRFTQIPDAVYHNLTVPVYTGVDWGAVDPFGILDLKYYDGGLYLHERNYSSENEIRAKMTDTERAQIAGADEGLVSWLFSRLGIPYDRTTICDNNRPTKILALRDAGWEYAVEADKRKGSLLDRIDLINNMRVYYTASSKNLEYEQENYSRKVDNNGVILDEPEDMDNHLIDPLGYLVLFLRSEGIIRKV